MKTYYPSYYKNFICIADKCPITCCQEWNIGVDDTTYDRWCHTTPPNDMPYLHKVLSDYTSLREHQHMITLNEEKKCPFLCKNKLCRLVLHHGDDILSETCTMFPREYHHFATHTEASLMPGCPAVLDLWQMQPQLLFPKISEIVTLSPEEQILFQVRDHILQIVQCPDYSPELSLLESFYILSELPTTALSGILLADYFSTETQTQLSAAITNMEFSTEDMLYECNELLQDLAVNYQKEGLYEKFLTPLLDLAGSISTNSYPADLSQKWKLFRAHWDKHAPLLRAFLSNEIFADLLLPDNDLNGMLIHLQWIGMEYAAIRYSIFLSWLLSGEHTLTYNDIRDAIVILTRMTGYDDDDIYEYLENSFESLYWEWGYFAMILADV